MVVALVLCLTVSMIVNITLGFLWADDKVMIKQLGEYNRELADEIDSKSTGLIFWREMWMEEKARRDRLLCTMETFSISKRDERGRFCGKVTAEQIVRGEV